MDTNEPTVQSAQDAPTGAALQYFEIISQGLNKSWTSRQLAHAMQTKINTGILNELVSSGHITHYRNNHGLDYWTAITPE